MGARHYDRRHFYERRISRFEMTDLLEDWMFVRDQGGVTWVNNDNGYYTPQARADIDKLRVMTIDEVYRCANVVLDGHRQLIARRSKLGGSLDRIKFVPKKI